MTDVAVAAGVGAEAPRPTLWTIGYEQATQDAVLGALREAEVELLADVRQLPLSRRPGFSKSALRAGAEAVGIAYRHYRALGTPPDGRAAAKRGNDAELARIYAGQLELPEAIAAAAELRSLAQEQRVALLCYERAPEHCHRRLLAEAMFADFDVEDLTP